MDLLNVSHFFRNVMSELDTFEKYVSLFHYVVFLNCEEKLLKKGTIRDKKKTFIEHIAFGLIISESNLHSSQKGSINAQIKKNTFSPSWTQKEFIKFITVLKHFLFFDLYFF